MADPGRVRPLGRPLRPGGPRPRCRGDDRPARPRGIPRAGDDPHQPPRHGHPARRHRRRPVGARGRRGRGASRWPASIGIPLTDPVLRSAVHHLRLDATSRPGWRSSPPASRPWSRSAPSWRTAALRWPGCRCSPCWACCPSRSAGHAAGATDHSTAVNALAVHLVGGDGLGRRPAGARAAATAASGRSPRPRASRTAARYSTLAGWCFAAVALSGLQSALIRIGPLQRPRHPLRRAAPGQDRGSAPARVCRVAAPSLAARRAARGPARGLRPPRRWPSSSSWGSRSAPPWRSRAAPRRCRTSPVAGRVAGVRADRLPRPRPAHRRLVADHLDDRLALAQPSRWSRSGSTSRGACGCAGAATRGRSTARIVVGARLGGLRLRDVRCAGRLRPGARSRCTWSMHMVIAMLVPLLLVPAAPILLALRALPARPDKPGARASCVLAGRPLAGAAGCSPTRSWRRRCSSSAWRSSTTRRCSSWPCAPTPGTS